jgi:hypothetical protein
VDALVKAAEGNPRRLNTVADNALFEAHLAGRDRVTPEDVERAARELGLGEATAEAPAAVAPAPSRAAREVPVRARAGSAEPARSAPPRPQAAPAAPVRHRAGPDAEHTVFFAEGDEEIAEVFAADTSPPVAAGDAETVALVSEEPRRRRARSDAGATVAVFDEGKGEGDGELDDLFADLVDD